MSFLSLKTRRKCTKYLTTYSDGIMSLSVAKENMLTPTVSLELYEHQT